MYLVKYFGIIIVFLCCCSFGFFKTANLKKRVRQLEEVIAGLLCLKEQIRFCGGELKTVLPICFKNVTVINTSHSKVKVENSEFSCEDISLVERFFDELGSGDTVAELNRIERAVSLLEKQHKTAKEDLDQKGKLWQSGGVCVGAMICILLI